MLITQKIAFFHIPKTGGVWVDRALNRGGLFTRQVDHMHSYPEGHDPNLINNRFKFAFVRNPLWWYRSFWSFRVGNGISLSRQDTILDKVCMSLMFSEFIENCCRETPGHLSGLYDAYTSGLDYVGRTENLCDDLIHVLNASGETFNESTVRETPMANCSKVEASYTPRLIDLIYKSERKAFDKYGYEIPLETILEKD